MAKGKKGGGVIDPALNVDQNLGALHTQQFVDNNPPTVLRRPKAPGIGVVVASDLDRTFLAQNFLGVGRALGKEGNKYIIRAGKESLAALTPEQRAGYTLHEAAALAKMFPDEHGQENTPEEKDVKINLRNKSEAMAFLDIARRLGVQEVIVTFNDLVPMVAGVVDHAVGSKQGTDIPIYSNLASNATGDHKNPALKAAMYDQGISDPSRVIFIDDDKSHVDYAARHNFSHAIHADPKDRTPQHLKEGAAHMFDAVSNVVQEHKHQLEQRLKGFGSLPTQKGKELKEIITDAGRLLGILNEEMRKIQSESNPTRAITGVNRDLLESGMTPVLKNSLETASREKQARLPKDFPHFNDVAVPSYAAELTQLKEHTEASPMKEGMKRVANSFKKNKQMLTLADGAIYLDRMEGMVKDLSAYERLVGGGSVMMDSATAAEAARPAGITRRPAVRPGQAQRKANDFSSAMPLQAASLEDLTKMDTDHAPMLPVAAALEDSLALRGGIQRTRMGTIMPGLGKSVPNLNNLGAETPSPSEEQAPLYARVDKNKKAASQANLADIPAPLAAAVASKPLPAKTGSQANLVDRDLLSGANKTSTQGEASGPAKKVAPPIPAKPARPEQQKEKDALLGLGQPGIQPLRPAAAQAGLSNVRARAQAMEKAAGQAKPSPVARPRR